MSASASFFCHSRFSECQELSCSECKPVRLTSLRKSNTLEFRTFTILLPATPQGERFYDNLIVPLGQIPDNGIQSPDTDHDLSSTATARQPNDEVLPEMALNQMAVGLLSQQMAASFIRTLSLDSSEKLSTLLEDYAEVPKSESHLPLKSDATAASTRRPRASRNASSATETLKRRNRQSYIDF
ncbi:hypothetical protein CPB83DRAFT_850010, partial [Crepidotus variabilis]